jgi:catalase (peroxidase I)
MRHFVYIFLQILFLNNVSFSALIDPSQFANEFKSFMPTCNEAARKWIRSAFHEAGTFDRKDNSGGSDGSLRFELQFSENIGVESTVDFCNNFVKKHPDVSFADAITFGSKIAVEICNGPTISWRFGRIDSTSANPRGRLPHPRHNIQQLNQIFISRMGFTKEETVALILGGHSVARVNHVFDFNKQPGFTDSTPHSMDNVIFKEITQNNLNGIVQIPADKNLLNDSDMKIIINNFAMDENLFKSKFKIAFEKLINLGSKFETSTTQIITTNIQPQPQPPVPNSTSVINLPPTIGDTTQRDVNTSTSNSNTAFSFQLYFFINLVYLFL